MSRSFKCIMTYENLPTNPALRKEEFRNQTQFCTMDPSTHKVIWNEGPINMGTIYSLDIVFSIRAFLDTTVFGIGKTTNVGRANIPLRELIDNGAAENPLEIVIKLRNVNGYESNIKVLFEFEKSEKIFELVFAASIPLRT
jgi:hypothetical protein